MKKLEIRLNKSGVVNFVEFIPPRYTVGGRGAKRNFDMAEVWRLKGDRYRSKICLIEVEKMAPLLGLDAQTYTELVMLHEVAHALIWARSYPLSHWGLEHLCDLIASKCKGVKGKTSAEIMKKAEKEIGAFFVTAASLAKNNDIKEIDAFLKKNHKRLRPLEISYGPKRGNSFARVVW